MSDTLNQLLQNHRVEAIALGVLVCLMIALLIYFTLSRRRRPLSVTHSSLERPAPERRRLQPGKGEILNSLVEFQQYPSFVSIMSEIVQEFSLDYLYSFPELHQAVERLIRFPEDQRTPSPAQRAAMMTIVRVFMDSDLIREKCGRLLDEHFDRFLEEAGLAG